MPTLAFIVVHALFVFAGNAFAISACQVMLDNGEPWYQEGRILTVRGDQLQFIIHHESKRVSVSAEVIIQDDIYTFPLKFADDDENLQVKIRELHNTSTKNKSQTAVSGRVIEVEGGVLILDVKRIWQPSYLKLQ